MPDETLDVDSLLYQLLNFHFTKDLEWVYDEGLTLRDVDPHLAEEIELFLTTVEGV